MKQQQRSVKCNFELRSVKCNFEQRSGKCNLEQRSGKCKSSVSNYWQRDVNNCCVMCVLPIYSQKDIWIENICEYKWNVSHPYSWKEIWFEDICE